MPIFPSLGAEKLKCAELPGPQEGGGLPGGTSSLRNGEFKIQILILGSQLYLTVQNLHLEIKPLFLASKP